MATRKHYGNGPRAKGRIQLQIGTKLKVGTDQAAELTEIWSGLWNDLINQTPWKDCPHPQFPGLLLTSKEFTLGKLGMATAILTYKGLDPGRPETGGGGESSYPEVDLEKDTDVEEVPIQAHPDFAALVTAAGGYAPGKACKDEKTGLFLGFGPLSGGDLAGVESYLVARPVTTRHWYSDEASNLPVGVSTSGGLRTSLKSTRQGKIWKNTEVIRGGAANPLIYG